MKPPLHGRELLEEMLEARILTYVRQRALLEMYAMYAGYDTIEPTWIGLDKGTAWDDSISNGILH